MKRTEPNPFALSAPLTDGKEELRQRLFGRDCAQREERRNYLLGIIAQQQSEAPVRNVQKAT